MRIDKELYISHIKEDDKKLQMRKILDKIEKVINNHSIESTDFLDPYERHLATSILNRFKDLSYLEFGGTSNSERKVLVIFHGYLDNKTIDSHLSFLRIDGDLEGLTHKDYLGGLLSLGIKRTKVGDIHVHEKYVDIIVKEEISNFILINLDRIGNKKVTLSEIGCEELIDPILKFNEINKFITSLRVDSILSSIYNLSRQESINIIKSGNVKVNWEQINRASKELVIGDIISTKGYGRAIVYSVDGMSKKGRLHVTFRILI